MSHVYGGVDGVFSVAEDDKGVCSVGGATGKVVESLLEYHAEVGAAIAGPFPIDLLKGVSQRCVVVGEGDNDVRLAGEDDEAYFVGRERVNEFVGCGSGFFQPRGGYILRFHGSGDVQGDDETAPGGDARLIDVAVDGAGKRQQADGKR